MENENKDNNEGFSKEPEAWEIHHHHYYSRNRGLGLGRIFIGILLVFVGAVFFAQTSGWLGQFELYFDWRLVWPLILVIIGLGLLGRGGWLSAVFGIIAMIIVLVLVFLSLTGQFSSGPSPVSTPLSIERSSAIQSAFVSVSYGAGSLKVRSSGPGSNLVSGELVSNFAGLSSDSSVDGTVQRINIKETGGNFSLWSGRNKNDLSLNLNPDIPFGLQLHFGAGSADLDFSNIALSAAEIEAGASDINLILGEKQSQAAVTLKAGASKITINLPRAVGARIRIESALSSRNFADFRQVEERVFESENYSSSGKKIDIAINAAASSIDVVWR